MPLARRLGFWEVKVEELTIGAAQGLLTSGVCSASELAQATLDAITRRDGEIGAYLSVDGDAALRDANAADERRRKGETGPLLGIPIAIKDAISVKGQPCTCASRILEGYVAPYDATVVARLKAAGAVMLGRTNMDEFAMGSSSENSAFQITHNPAKAGYVAGGSSGGSAAAVAGGLALGALGSDTGGSIRQPASFCGCVGLKPSYGRVSRYGLTAFASSLDQIGPLARTVADAAAIFEIIAGHDPLDSTTLDAPVPALDAALRTTSLAGMTLGLPSEYFVGGVDSEVRARIEDGVALCRELGARVVEVSLPHTRYAIASYYIIATAEASTNLARFDGVRYGLRARRADDPIEMYRRTRADGFGQEVKRRIIFGAFVLSGGYYDAYYLSAQKVRTLIRRDFSAVFERCDAILTPVAPTAAYPVGANFDDPLHMYLGDIFTVTANLAGICGMSIPCGATSLGLPVGIQALAPAFGEETLIKIGAALDRSLGNRHAG